MFSGVCSCGWSKSRRMKATKRVSSCPDLRIPKEYAESGKISPTSPGTKHLWYRLNIPSDRVKFSLPVGVKCLCLSCSKQLPERVGKYKLSFVCLIFRPENHHLSLKHIFKLTRRQQYFAMYLNKYVFYYANRLEYIIQLLYKIYFLRSKLWIRTLFLIVHYN